MNDQDFKMNLNYYRDYFDAVLFGEIDDKDQPLDTNYDILDIDKKSMIEQFAQLDKFFSLVSEILESSDYTHEQACHDFYFTRVGHGVGFWENDHCTESQGEKLTDIAESMGRIYTYAENDKVYID